MELPEDWKEFIASLLAHRVRFLIVGAHALAANGRPRATQDIDFWVEPGRANAERVCAALVEFGFPALGEAVEDFATPNRMVTLGRPPMQIDVMTSIDGVDFGRAWKNRLEVDFGGAKVGFLGRTEMLENKRASGRPKDLADIALLEEDDGA
jgi:hypothetical protein